jgi:uncharacterized protein YqfA (UPF0365 family)
VFIGASQFAALVVGDALVIGGIAVAVVAALVGSLVLFHYGTRWIQGYMSGADVRMMSLIGMSFHRVKPSMIVTAKIMGRQAGLNIDRDWGMSTARLESDVMHVLRAIIAAHRAGIDLDFDRAAAIDLAGRDVLDAVRTSVSPKVIDCPEPQTSGKTTLSAVAKNGVELHIRATRRPVRRPCIHLASRAQPCIHLASRAQ